MCVACALQACARMSMALLRKKYPAPLSRFCPSYTVCSPFMSYCFVGCVFACVLSMLHASSSIRLPSSCAHSCLLGIFGWLGCSELVRLSSVADDFGYVCLDKGKERLVNVVEDSKHNAETSHTQHFKQ